MAKTPNELKSMITELENEGFKDLHDKLDKVQAQLYGHEEYANSLVAGLHESIQTRVSMPSPAPHLAADQITGILRCSLSFHVEPPPDQREHNRSPAKQKADKEERYYAYAWNDIDMKGRVSSQTWRRQSTDVACWWLSYSAFQLPKDEDAQDKYRKTYQPFKVEVVDPRTALWLPDHAGQPADLSARHFKLSYRRIAEVYGDEEVESDPHALEILGRRFPGLRGSRGEDPTAGDLYQRTAEVWILDDSNYCCHAFKLPDSSGRGYAMEQVTEDYANPWGGPPLIIVPGAFNADAVAIADRYEPLVMALCRAQRVIDVMDSQMASMAYTPVKPVEQLQGDVATRMDPDEAREIQFSDSGITSIMGTLGEVKMTADPMLKDLRQMRLQDRDEAKPPPFLTNPDQGMVKYGDVTAQLQAVETSNRLYDAAREYYVEAVWQVCMKIKNFICYGYKDFNVKDAPVEEKIHFIYTGKENPARQYAGDWIGKAQDIGPSDFEDADTLEVDIVATSQSQKKLEFDAKHQERVLGYATWEDVVATMTEDVSGQKMKVEEELRYQRNAAIIDNLQLMADIEEIVREGGPDLSALYMQGMGMAGGPEQQQGSPPKDPNSVNIQTSMAPPTEPSNVSVTG